MPYQKIKTNDELVDIVSRRRNYLGLRGFDARAIQAMRNVDRAAFAPPGVRDCYEDEPFPIGCGQTCSQPSMVAAMATMMELRAGLRVLEVGTGCGYSAAVCAQLIAPVGRLFSIEFVPDLTELARRNLDACPNVPKNWELITGDGSAGLPRRAPFDRICFTAGVGRHFEEIPLLEQLSNNGILIYPEAYGSMFVVSKTAEGVKRREMPGVGFVQLQGENSGFD